jgi:hypothetical protein
LKLGLRHCDFVSRRREVRIVPRADNANGARAKVRSAAVVPVSAPLVRLYSEYMHVEYGGIDSDYVLSGCRDNTYCPEPGVIRTGLAQLLVIAMTMFRSTT